MALVQRQFKDFFNNTGGLNTVKSAILLDNTEARDIQDMDLFPIGGFTKRNGFTKLDSPAPDTSTVSGLFMARYTTAGGTNIAYRVSGATLYSMTAALNGTWTDRTNSLTITSGANNIWNFDILNDIVVMGNGVDSPIHINSSAVSSNPAGLPFTTFVFPVQYRGYMWYFVPTVSGSVKYDRGYFSSINDPATVGSSNFVNVGVGTGGIVAGAVDFKTYLNVFKRSGIYQINFQPTAVDSNGNIFPFTQFPNPVVPGVGTQSPRSIVKFTTPATHALPGQEFCFFVDQFGIPRLFDGTTTISFASKIGSSRDTTILSLTNMDNTRLPYCFAVNYPSKNRLLFFLSQLNSKQDRCWVLDYNTGFALSRYKYASAFNCGALFEKSDGTFKPYVGDYTGAVHQLDQGSTDNGQPISDYYVTGDTYLKSPSLRSKWFDLDVRGTNGSTSQSATINYYLDGGDTPVKTGMVSLADPGTQWASFIWGQAAWAKAGMVTRTDEVNLAGKTIRTRIESTNKLTDTLTVEGFSLAAEVLGTAQN